MRFPECVNELPRLADDDVGDDVAVRPELLVQDRTGALAGALVGEDQCVHGGLERIAHESVAADAPSVDRGDRDPAVDVRVHASILFIPTTGLRAALRSRLYARPSRVREPQSLRNQPSIGPQTLMREP